MDLSGAATYSRYAAQNDVAQEVGVRMLSNTVDQMRQSGEQLANIIQTSGAIQVSPQGVGNLVDIQA
ncbi:MAG: putative motility protein [Treponema sp.]|nr:putative motility protein [Treponema sp.]